MKYIIPPENCPICQLKIKHYNTNNVDTIIGCLTGCFYLRGLKNIDGCFHISYLWISNSSKKLKILLYNEGYEETQISNFEAIGARNALLRLDYLIDIDISSAETIDNTINLLLTFN